MQTVSAEIFYDHLAHSYDEMTDCEQRIQKELPVFEQLIKKFSVRSALDAGCGTGLHSMLLAKLGVHVTAIDVAGEMIALTKRRAEELMLPVQTFRSDFKSPAGIPGSPFDAVFCLGNTLPHIESSAALGESMENFNRLVKPGGVGVFQMLNFTAILHSRERIRNIKERNGKTYIRFYDFENDRIVFNILKLDRTSEGVVHQLQSTKLLPVKHDELVMSVNAAGWRSCELYGSLSLTPFHELVSPDLVAVARK